MITSTSISAFEIDRENRENNFVQDEISRKLDSQCKISAVPTRVHRCSPTAQPSLFRKVHSSNYNRVRIGI